MEQDPSEPQAIRRASARRQNQLGNCLFRQSHSSSHPLCDALPGLSDSPSQRVAASGASARPLFPRGSTRSLQELGSPAQAWSYPQFPKGSPTPSQFRLRGNQSGQIRNGYRAACRRRQRRHDTGTLTCAELGDEAIPEWQPIKLGFNAAREDGIEIARWPAGRDGNSQLLEIIVVVTINSERTRYRNHR
jgi:hypothetical protein